MLIFLFFFCYIRWRAAQQKIKPKDKNEPSSLNYTIRNSKFIHVGCFFSLVCCVVDVDDDVAVAVAVVIIICSGIVIVGADVFVWARLWGNSEII